MLPKPTHLSHEYASQFQDDSVVSAYRHRPGYPPDLFPLLASLITEQPRRVLDVGCGTGFVARPMVSLVDGVDAVDFSAHMLEAGKLLPNGDHPKLNWIHGSAEDAPLQPPYALITAGASLHWMDWAVAFPRFQASLTPHGTLAIVENSVSPSPWDTALKTIIARYSTNQDFAPYNLLDELEKRRLFDKIGQATVATMPFTQPVEEYIEAFHARNGFSRRRMGDAQANAFDREVLALLAQYSVRAQVELEIGGGVIWGRPQFE